MQHMVATLGGSRDLRIPCCGCRSFPWHLSLSAQAEYSMATCALVSGSLFLLLLQRFATCSAAPTTLKALASVSTVGQFVPFPWGGSTHLFI